jgi:hypothetical protein
MTNTNTILENSVNTWLKGCDYLNLSHPQLNGENVKQYLESIGETVIKYGDTGWYEFAITASGYKLYSNGYVTKV